MKNITKKAYLNIFISTIFIFLLNSAFPQCPIEVNLGNDTLLCPGTSIILDAGPGELYVWDDPQVITRYRTITNPGTYTVKVKIFNCPLFGEDTIVINPAPVLAMDLKLPVRPLPYFCKGELANLTSEVSDSTAVIKYEWSISPSNTASITVDTTRIVTLTITDKNGCKWTKSKEVEFQFPFEKDSIKLATYDPTEDKTVVVYTRSYLKRTRSYILFNGYTDKDSLTTIPFSASNLVVDPTSKPHLRPSYYNIMLVDSCLNRSTFKIEKTHKTMFLEVTRETDGKTTLEWNRYIGFNYPWYYIRKGTSPANMTVIDSVRHFPLVDRVTYTDNTPINMVYYYQVIIKTPDTVYVYNPGKKAQAGPFVHSASNMEDNRLYGTGIMDLEYLKLNLKTYPNPYHGITTIQYEIDNRAEISLKVFNITGQQIAVLEEGVKEPGRYEIPFSASFYGLPPGMYYLKYFVKGTGVVTRKLVEQ